MSDPYNPTTPEAIAARLTTLRERRAKRAGISEYKVNVPAIDAEIARLEALAAAP
jgi:hypothetical protein